MIRTVSLFLILIFLFDGKLSEVLSQELGAPAIEFSPERYVVHRAKSTINVDGKLNEESWKLAEWTNPFVDIRGDEAPAPRFNTRAKMLWDDDYFYFAAQLEEPHVWATLTERDAVIFMDNNFEVFIDPNGDTHNYYELEVNAFGTFWDLMLTHPYRNSGMAIDAWDIKGLKVGIDIQGTINDPTDIDEGWSVELAIPWSVLEEAAPGGRPDHGTQWRVNFSRVQWQTDIVNGEYVKRTDPETGENLPEDNWSWSPQGLINMHYPEMWGFVQFSDHPAGTDGNEFEWKSDEDYKWLLRKLYYRQIDHKEAHGSYTSSGEDLEYSELYRQLISDTNNPSKLTINVLDNYYLMRLIPEESGYIFYIRDDSKVWMVEK